MAAQQPSLFGDDAKTCLARADEQLKQVTQKHRELIQLFNNGFKHAWNQVPGALALEAGAMKEAMQTGNLSRAQELYNDFSDRTGELSSVLTYVVSAEISVKSSQKHQESQELIGYLRKI